MSIISTLVVPLSWKLCPFGRVAPRVQVTGRPDLEPLSVFLDEGVVPRSSREDNHNQLGEDLGKYLIVQPGDIVFNKLRTWQGGLGVSRHEGIVSPAYFVCRPTSEYDPRYLHYLLRSQPYLQELTRISKWMPPSQFDIGWEQLRLLPVLAPHQVVQSAIADYLDRETARIDTLIAKKQRMMDLLDARRAALIEEIIRGLVERYGAIPLKHAVRRVEVGIVITPAAWYSDEGILALRGLNVRPGELVLDDVVKISEEGHRLNQKSELHTGDVVVVRTGQTGTAAIVPESLDGCNCIDLVIVRPSTIHLPKFLEFVLNSDWTQKHVEAYSVGTIQSHFNVGAMKEVPVPAAPLTEQRAAANDLTLATAALDQLRQKLAMQVDLLVQRRQALITAAVTGELEIPVAEAVA